MIRQVEIRFNQTVIAATTASRRDVFYMAVESNHTNE